MWVVEIQEYDYFTGNRIDQYVYECEEEAEKRYTKEKSRDFDYGDHYRKTTLFKARGS